jgi:uncharacterized protein YbjQ (UPF0145 family)
MLSTTESLFGKSVKSYKGFVFASVVRSKHLGHDFYAMLKSIRGGDIKSYENLTNQARFDVLKKLEENAKKQGADAVICIRMGTTQVLPSTLEVYAYGTAVVFKK